ncbi:MAG: DUF4375 domain-containing protein [Methylophilaceae bacterium]
MNLTNHPTWQRLEARWDGGFELLMPEEQEAIALWWLETETMNGTLDQFFWNSSGDLALIALSGLKKLDMQVTTKAFESALQYFGDDYPIDRSARAIALEKIEAEHGEDVFTPASRIIQNLPEDFVQTALERLDKIYAKTSR